MSNRIPQTTKAWLAALIDGEGCIVLNRRHKNAPGRPQYRIQIRVYNTDKRLIREIIKKTGAGRISVMSLNQPGHKKTAYYWALRPTEQEAWLKRLLPWFVCKREQALLILEVIRIKRALQPHRGKRWLRPSESAALTRKITAIYGKTTKLNRKGRRTSD